VTDPAVTDSSRYQPQALETRWQELWDRHQLHRTP
jgi:leucyl-tRNA synthetase